MGAGVDNLVTAIRSVTATQDLFPLAATALGLLTTSTRSGGLLVAHLTLLQAARRCEGEAMSERDWAAFRQLLDRLAHVLTATDAATLDALADAWRTWVKPAALQ